MPFFSFALVGRDELLQGAGDLPLKIETHSFAWYNQSNQAEIVEIYDEE